jgi:hypothetical protein
MVNDKIGNDIKMYICCGQFEGLAEAPVLCGVHCLMQHVQGYSGRHWALPSGN